jgi:hypothetical protein
MLMGNGSDDPRGGNPSRTNCVLLHAPAAGREGLTLTTMILPFEADPSVLSELAERLLGAARDRLPMNSVLIVTQIPT